MKGLRHVMRGVGTDRSQHWRARTRVGLLAGALLLVAVGCLVLPLSPAVDGDEMTGLVVRDLDEDGQPERWSVVRSRQGRYGLHLHSTAKGGHDHPVVPLADAPDARFEQTPGADEWHLRTPSGADLGMIRLVTQPDRTTPDAFVLAGELAKRYVFVERGFIKLDALEVIPGFSAGLVMLGDRREVLEAMAGPIAPDGGWVLPLATPLAFTIRLDAAGRVLEAGSRSPRLQTKGDMGVGVLASALATRYPGQRQGSEWRSLRYGLVAQLDQAGRIASLTVTRPRTDTAKRTR